MHKNEVSFFPHSVITVDQNREAYQCGEKKTMGSRDPAGPRRLETATRMSASLFRRLSAFFGSTSDQGQKAAKYAVLTPGHAGFPNRAKRSEGSDTTPTWNARVSACEPLCARFGAGVACVPAAVPRNERCGVCGRCAKRLGEFCSDDGKLSPRGWVFPSRPCPVSEVFAPYLPVR